MTGHPREEVTPTLRLLWLCARCLLRHERTKKRQPPVAEQLPLVEVEEWTAKQ
jgi:hypothetical protein